MTKTKSKKDEPICNDVPCVYDYIDKKYLIKYENPNFHHHQLKIPFRMLIVGSSGAGKSQLIVHILNKMKNTFGNIKLFCRNKDEPIYNYINDKIPSTHLQIYEGLDKLPSLSKDKNGEIKEFDKDLQHLVIFDDLVLEKDQSRICEYFIRARKIAKGISIMYLTQSYFGVPKTIRINLNYMILKKLSSLRDLNLIMSDYNLGIDKNKLLSIYEYCTDKTTDFLLLDLDNTADKRYRHNLLEVIDTKKEYTSNNNKNENLKAELKEEIEGGGLLDGMISKNFNNKSRYILKLYGNLPIVKIDVIKNVVNPLITSTLNWLAQKNYDKLYHLGLIVYFSNGKSIILQKEATIKIDDIYSLKNRELKNIEIPNNLTLSTLLKTVYDKVGNKLFLYSGYNNNCQNFVINILESNNLLNDEDLRNYIKQDTDDIFQNDKVRKVVNSVTDLGAVIDNGLDVVDNIKNNISDKINNFTGMSNNMTTGSGVIVHKVMY
jgi:energy-coupling factor transporter ATP-binding protein EcfA2